MRRILGLIMISALVLASGCAQKSGIETTSAGDGPAGRDAEVYAQVLRRYVTTPADNSFPENTFKVVYVLDAAHAGVGDPAATPGKGEPILPDAQAHIISTLKDTNVKFISDKESVLDKTNDCAQVKDDGVLITLGTVDGDGNEVKVGINGYVACLGATWLTYVLRNEAGIGWKVTGTTGPVAIS